MNIYHSYFKFWRNFKEKQKYCWIAITKTYPIDYIGNVYRKLAPIGKNFDKVTHPYNEKLFIKEYISLLKSLNKNEILKDIKSFSKNGKDIVLLNWEDLSILSEGRIAYTWLLSLKYETINAYDLEAILSIKEKEKDIIGNNFLFI